MNPVDVETLCDIAEIEFADIVERAIIPDLNEVRIFLRDDSFIDLWFSLKQKGRYSYHWERLAIDNTIYRHDNAPHGKWRTVSTYPHHFHNGSEENVVESNLSSQPESALREFLAFVRTKLSS